MKLMTIMSYPEGTQKNSNKYKKQLNKIEGWSRDGSAKKYTNKICRDNVSHPLYIPTLAFWVAMHTHIIIIYGAHAGMENQYHKPMDSDTLHTESEVYDINYQKKQV